MLTQDTRVKQWAFGLILLSLFFNVVAWFDIGILPDEAYYWVWSQRLQGGYFDHPSLVAWLIAPFAALFHDQTWAIRIPSVLAWLVGTALAFRLAERLYRSREAGLLAALIWASLPVIQIGFHIVTPDSPMLLFAWATYYLAYLAVETRRPLYWLLTGAAIGLTVWGKYPGGLVALGLLFALPLSADGRGFLKTPWPWLATVVALLVFSPVLVWNAHHDWISFTFQITHGIHEENAVNPLHTLGLFLGGQMAATLPWTWLAMVWAAAFGLRRDLPGQALHRHILLLGFALPLLLFGFAALTAEGHPNWPVTAYVPGTIILAGTLQRWLFPGQDQPARVGRIVTVSVAFLLSLLLVNLLRFPGWIEAFGVKLPPQRTQLSQTYGWDRVSDTLIPLLITQQQRNPYGAHCTIVADKLQTASMVGLILHDANRVTTSVQTRTNQFTLWAKEHPIPQAALCLYFAQYEENEKVLDEVDLGTQGKWRLEELLSVNNPDKSRRRFGFYLPEK